MKKCYEAAALTFVSLLALTGCAGEATASSPKVEQTVAPSPINTDPHKGWVEVQPYTSIKFTDEPIAKKCDGTTLLYASVTGSLAAVAHSDECRPQ